MTETNKAQLKIQQKEKRLKFLVIRPDRIGDVVLSTPVLEALKKNYPGAEIHMLVRDSVVPIIRHHEDLSRTIVYRPNSVHSGLVGFYRLWRTIRREHYDVAITLQVQFKVSLAVYLSRIRYRVGPLSKWYSYHFFNRGIRQRRSSVSMHEADYNLMLLRKLGIRVPARRYDPRITVDADAKERMRAFVRSAGFEDGQPFVIVHPGMGGSALNWPEGYYSDLLKRLAQKNVNVIVTGGASEKGKVDHVLSDARNGLSENEGAKIGRFVGELSDTGLSDLMGLMALSQVVVAPSTGPLHIAAALGKRTVSFYSPIKVQSVLRWGPYANDESRHSILVPDALCGQDFKCAGPKCPFYFCMERVSVEEALQAVLHQLESSKA